MRFCQVLLDFILFLILFSRLIFLIFWNLLFFFVCFCFPVLILSSVAFSFFLILHLFPLFFLLLLVLPLLPPHSLLSSPSLLHLFLLHPLFHLYILLFFFLLLSFRFLLLLLVLPSFRPSSYLPPPNTSFIPLHLALYEKRCVNSKKEKLVTHPDSG